MTRVLPLLLAAGAAFAHASVTAQEARLINIGDTVRHDLREAADIYRLPGLKGMSIRLKLDVVGPSSVTLYTPEGSEMLSATGGKGAVLDAALPADAVYYLGVSAGRKGPYTLKITGGYPDAFVEGTVAIDRAASELAASEELQALNSEQLRAAEAQRQKFDAERRAYQEQQRAYENQQQAYLTAKAKHEAEVRAAEDARRKWEADVAACKAGDHSRCAPKSK
ncbi:hypothetical protein [Sphingomonas cavernae]|uniref:Uncharacterized protein n=1 Tax=Sphingomonas cavernae TaxID=2320861 RepID=A0A418WS31_9SPHN|nr:hypothetical protein [Sphingomonas cavernae]RJF94035.1 hypothetical protein D3876_07165 [Sphingomonas cavernae]